MDDFLTPAWFSAIGAALADHAGTGGEVVSWNHPDRPELHHFQVWHDGELVAWRAGRAKHTDAVIAAPASSLQDLLYGGTHPDAVSAIDAEGIRWTLPLTAADLRRIAGEQRWPGATFDVEVTLMDQPLGSATLPFAVRDGLVIGAEAASGAALELELPFVDGLRVLTGELPFRAIAARSRVSGPIHVLACLSGLIAAPSSSIRLAAGRSAIRAAASAISRTSRLADTAWLDGTSMPVDRRRAPGRAQCPTATPSQP